MDNDIVLIGDGGYGCVIQPPVEMKYIKKYIEYTNKNSKDVGKLYRNKDDFMTELKLLKGVDEIDKQGLFSVKLKGANIINDEKLNDDILECLQLNETDENIYQIILEYGGKQISKVSKYSIPFKKFMKLLKVFVNGIHKIHSYDLVHQDIKPSNVLLNENKISLIDFGISELANEIYSNKNKSRLSSEYKYHPPEFYIAYLLLDYKKSHNSFQEKLETVVQDMIENGYLHEIFDSSKVERVSDELTSFVKQIQNNDLSYNEVFNKNLAYKSDVYSLSFVLKEFHNKVIFDNDDQKDVFQSLYDMSSAKNPFKRSSIKDILEYINVSEQNISYKKDDQTGGGKTRRLRFPKMYKHLTDDKSQDPPSKYKLPSIVKKHLHKK